MTMGTMFLCLPIFLALYVLTKNLLNKIRNLPPTPYPSLPIIGHLYLLNLNKGPLCKTLAQISKRKGPIIHFQFGSRRVLLVSSPSAAGECFTRNDIVFANRPRFLIGKHLGYDFTSLSWAPYGDLWRNLRRIATIEILSATRIQLLTNIRVDEIRSLICRLFHNQSPSVNLRNALQELTLNVMMRMIAGKRYYGENESNLEEAKKFREIHAETVRLTGEKNIGDYLPWIKSRELEKRMIGCRRKRDEFMHGLIKENRRKMESTSSDCSSHEKTKTLIEVLLALQDTDPEYFKDEVISSLMLVLLLAGTDTTVNTIEWAFSLLVNHPEALKKAQIEIDNRVGPGRLFEESDLAYLPWLRGIINETLRMYPSAPLLLPHESQDDCTVGSFNVPRGTILLVNAWAIQNDPKNWVEPRKFEPQRFEGVEGARDGFRLMPFGSGRRGCPGEGLGLRMVGLALGSLIRCFEWERTSEEMVDMSEGNGFTLPKNQPLQVKCHPRPIMLNLLSQTLN